MAKAKIKDVSAGVNEGENGIQGVPGENIIPDVLENLKTQYQQYVAEAEKFKTMANKALGAIEVLSSLTDKKE